MKNLQIILFIVILMVASVVSFFLGSNIEKRDLKNTRLVYVKVPTSSQDKIISKLVDTQGEDKDFIVTTSISQGLKGTLNNFTENSWTIEQNGRKLTVVNESEKMKPAVYFYDPKTKKRTWGKRSDLSKGTDIIINTTIIPGELKLGIGSIYIVK